jgi:SpoVK/Ycf46/Vps4 family AAA+-type ATPase
MVKFQLTEEHLNMLKRSCDNNSINNINLKTLKALATFYYKHFPDDVEYNNIMQMNNYDMRSKITKILCENYDRLYSILHPDHKVDMVKKLDKIELTNHFKKFTKEDAEKHFKGKFFGDPLKDDSKYFYKGEVKKEYMKKENKSDELKSAKIILTVKPVDKDYLIELKKKVDVLETNQYNINKFEEDIKDDEFIKKAIDAHIKALEYKLKNYEKLSLINWKGAVKDDGGNKGYTVDLNELIKKMMGTIRTKLHDIKSNPNIIKKKREDLYSIIYDKDNGIATLQGTSRDNIKISLLKNMYMFFKIPHFFFKGFNNFMITGSAGSGKTKLASVIAYMMNNLGILATDNLVIATKQNLIGEFVGTSAPKTRNLLANALEGVLFIDEAYTLTSCDKDKKDSYAEEAIGELINFIDKFIGCLVVIVAGYKDKMNDCFLTFNEGISRRFPKIIDLIPYNSKDMYKIFELFLSESIEVNKIFTKKQREIMKSIVYALNENLVFNNQAGDMLNLSKVIGEDAILFDSKYNDEMIKYSFMKFCATKNVAIDF